MAQLRARDYHLTVGELPTGLRNKLTDVPGVTVGHCTIDTPEHKTGVTVILPGPENPFTHKCPAAAVVFNGFGKTAGLMQLEELGTLETPIALTNTLNVGLVHDALVEYMINRCESDGFPLYSVNPIVSECNDAGLNHIQKRAVGREEVFRALSAASPDFEEGNIGAGNGMVCHGLKGGIGSSSRLLEIDGQTYTLGALVLANHGRMEDLTICGNPIGSQLEQNKAAKESDVGSCIVILATDLPLDSRQLKRSLFVLRWGWLAWVPSSAREAARFFWPFPPPILSMGKTKKPFARSPPSMKTYSTSPSVPLLNVPRKLF